MLTRTITPDGTRYYQNGNNFHNPHRYSIEYDYGEKARHLNGYNQNIVGPQRIFSNGSVEYKIKNERIR